MYEGPQIKKGNNTSFIENQSGSDLQTGGRRMDEATHLLGGSYGSNQRLRQQFSQLTGSEARQEQSDRLLTVSEAKQEETDKLIAFRSEKSEWMAKTLVKEQRWGIRRLIMAGFDQSILVRKSGFFSWLTSWKFTQKQIDKAKLPALDRINNGDTPDVLLQEGYHKSEVDQAVSMRTTRGLNIKRAIKRAVMLACLLIGLPALMLLLL